MGKIRRDQRGLLQEQERGIARALATCLAAAVIAAGLGAGPAGAASTEYRTLSVGSYVPGGGTVALSPEGLACDVGGFTCTAQFPLGTVVTVTAPPNKGFAFSGFTRDCAGPVCVLAMDADKKVDVDFVRFAPLGKLKRDERKGTAVLTVRVGGPGTLVASGRRVERQEIVLPEDANVKVPILARGSATKRLGERGLVKVDVKVAFTPTAGTLARFSRSLWLRRGSLALPALGP